ncbi:CvpA family protein [Bizionia argentinensis JUB59]|uniref:CvpA family protein n=1 Tax=Bizionia argentinensis JUB59 TaxID=1046627 RepID=G2EF69_9FLAO|nr:CvpA family protein [Bizionia argentinensis]EGV42858.1 CvpA family protein [Bizionia argentinensis JUB59]
MTVIDIILVALLGFGLVRGFLKGFFVEIASLVALVAGIYGAIHFSFYTAEMLISYVEWDEKTLNIVAFAITFIVIVLVISLAGKALTKLADFAALGILNKLLGALFGAMKMALILSVLLNIFDAMNTTLTFVDEEHTKDATLYEPVKSLAPMIFPFVIKSTEDESEDDKENTNKDTEAETNNSFTIPGI